MSVEDLTDVLQNLRIDKSDKMNADEISKILESAVRIATQAQKAEFEKQIEELSQRIASIPSGKPEVKTYEEAKLYSAIKCEETLDVVKSLPDFDGKIEHYVSWRQAAHTAYKVFEKYDGSSKHYQALAIIRNKIKGPADAVLASFNTVLNFSAIIARLDFTYADKRPIYLIEQELSTLRQGEQTVIQFYDEIERKLSLLTNKTIMTYDKTLAMAINEKYRQDALRIFVSGLRKPLCDILFSARASDMPTALALAQEVEANHARYVFATAFSSKNEEKKGKVEQTKRNNSKKSDGNWSNGQQGSFRQKNPHFEKNFHQNSQTKDQVEPMEVDPTSSRYRQPTNQHYDGNKNYSQKQNFKRHAGSDRYTGPKFQRIDNVGHEIPSQEDQEEHYNEISDTQSRDVDDELLETSEYVNFLGVAPCYRS